MNFTYIKDKYDYIKFIDSVQDKFGCIEDWEYFFGFNLKWDEKTGEVLETIFDYQGDIEYCPNSFPAIVYSLFDDGEDRLGQFGIRIVDFATFEELCEYMPEKSGKSYPSWLEKLELEKAMMGRGIDYETAEQILSDFHNRMQRF